MSDLGIRFRAALWWLVPLAAAAVLIGWETQWGRVLRTLPPPEKAIAPKSVTTSLLPEYAIAGGLAARTDTVQRTLFNPTRRPAPPAAADAAKTRMQRGQFTLTGTTVVDGKSTAFLRETAGGKSRRVLQGEAVNGLVVAEVRADRVKLALGDESEELILKVATNPRPTVPPPVVAGAAPAAAQPRGQAQGQAQGGGAAAAAQDPSQSLSDRRRAARAGQGEAQTSGSNPVPSGSSGAAPAPAAATSAAPAQVGSGFEAMDQRYRDRAARRK